MKNIPLLLMLMATAPVWASQGSDARFKTEDGWTITGLYRAPRLHKPVAILVHGVAAGKSEWEPLAAELERHGIGSLAIDMRGHGESLLGPAGKTDFRDFDTTQEWLRARKDIEAAVAFLKERGIATSRVGYIGASIGANLVSGAEPKPRFLVLLSPGLNYRGVRLVPPSQGVPVLVAAWAGDSYAFETAQAFTLVAKGTLFLTARQGHGAQMLADPKFFKKLVGWIEKPRVQKP